MVQPRLARRRSCQERGVCLFVLLAASGTAAADVTLDPAAMALLRGVESVRLIEGPVRIEAIVEQIAPSPVVDLHYVLEVEGDKMMSTLLEVQQDGKSISDGEVTLLDGTEVYFLSRGKHSDVAVSDLDARESVRGGFLFDPAILGLTDLLSVHSTVKSCLHYQTAEDVELVGQEELNGVDVWHVKLSLEDYIFEFWVEEPAFRVHRTVTAWPGTRIQIDLGYEPGNPSPFPSWLHHKRTIDGQVRREGKVTIKDFKIGAEFEPDHFTLKGMDVPINTPVVDYRIKRRIGYWDGEGLSEWPVDLRKDDRPNGLEGSREEVRSSRWALFFGSVVLIVVCGVVWRLQRRAAEVPPKT